MAFKPGRMRLGRAKPKKAPKAPTKPKVKRKKKVRLEAEPKELPKSKTPLLYPDEDLSKYRPRGDSLKAVAAQKVFDEFPEKNSWGGQEALDHIRDSLEGSGFKANPGNLEYIRWMLSGDGNIAGMHPKTHMWPYPRNMCADPQRNRAWRAKREFGARWQHIVMTLEEFSKDKKARNVDRLEQEKKWKRGVAVEYGRKSKGFAFPKKKKD